MQVQAIWENGVFRPTVPLALKDHTVTIQVPDELMDNTDSLPTPLSLDNLLSQHPDDGWLKMMKEIEERILAIPEEQLPELTAKQRERIAAFALREDL